MCFEFNGLQSPNIIERDRWTSPSMTLNGWNGCLQRAASGPMRRTDRARVRDGRGRRAGRGVAGFCAAHGFVRLPDSLRLVLPMRIAAGGTEQIIPLRTLRSEPRKREGMLKVVRIGIQGSKQACGGALSCGSAVVPSQTVVRTELRTTTAPTMPNVIESPPDCAFWCFPHASPALASGAGKRPTAPKERSKPLISLRKTGAGEGIRTLDPNLGKVVLYP